MNWIKISEYPNITLLQIDQDQLSINNIESISEFGNSGAIPEITGNFLGGVLLKVQKKNLEKALQILKTQELNQLEKEISHFEQEKNPIQEDISNQSNTSKYTSTAFEFFLYLVLPTFSGYYLDEHLQNTSYIGTIIGTIIGFAVGIYKLIIFAKNQND